MMQAKVIDEGETEGNPAGESYYSRKLLWDVPGREVLPQLVKVRMGEDDHCAGTFIWKRDMYPRAAAILTGNSCAGSVMRRGGRRVVFTNIDGEEDREHAVVFSSTVEYGRYPDTNRAYDGIGLVFVSFQNAESDPLVGIDPMFFSASDIVGDDIASQRIMTAGYRSNSLDWEDGVFRYTEIKAIAPSRCHPQSDLSVQPLCGLAEGYEGTWMGDSGSPLFYGMNNGSKLVYGVFRGDREHLERITADRQGISRHQVGYYSRLSTPATKDLLERSTGIGRNEDLFTWGRYIKHAYRMSDESRLGMCSDLARRRIGELHWHSGNAPYCRILTEDGQLVADTIDYGTQSDQYRILRGEVGLAYYWEDWTDDLSPNDLFSTLSSDDNHFRSEQWRSERASMSEASGNGAVPCRVTRFSWRQRSRVSNVRSCVDEQLSSGVLASTGAGNQNHITLKYYLGHLDKENNRCVHYNEQEDRIKSVCNFQVLIDRRYPNVVSNQ